MKIVMISVLEESNVNEKRKLEEYNTILNMYRVFFGMKWL